MRLSIKTTGLLGKHLPEGSQRNRGDVDLADGSTVQDLLDTLAIANDGRCYVSINDSLLQQDEFATRELVETDKVVLLAPITAG